MEAELREQNRQKDEQIEALNEHLSEAHSRMKELSLQNIGFQQRLKMLPQVVKTDEHIYVQKKRWFDRFRRKRGE